MKKEPLSVSERTITEARRLITLEYISIKVVNRLMTIFGGLF